MAFDPATPTGPNGSTHRAELDRHWQAPQANALDLRLFLRHWCHGFALRETLPSGHREGLQFFDAQGVAVHKLWLADGGDATRFDALVERFRGSAPQPLGIQPEPPCPAPVPDHQIEQEALRWAWLAMTNTHEFHALLRRFRVDRLQALRLAGPDLARRAPADSYRSVLEAARDRTLPIMLFVGNRGCIQIHAGLIDQIEPTGDGLAVRGPGLHLQVLEAPFAEAWVVSKPTEQGPVTSLECYGRDGDLLLQCFGLRKGQESESAAWRDLLEALPRDET